MGLGGDSDSRVPTLDDGGLRSDSKIGKLGRRRLPGRACAPLYCCKSCASVGCSLGAAFSGFIKP